ncbi:FosX/FosE/FosI family fosfomycin resistance thiol transferase [Paracoccus aurantiacus]|uniref:FosX/FosE/FosI family fosfomycin resistance thiol transferase n=1 Tax=Paracoccus aurantiacus TaxID=2599412 RepID=A0A5C6S5N5_9RHOB|nr:FosX/FosE/FosI family fosfomycin resistance hydrolase [Paracoccus aurantiacus]TXB69743.1 FosX/FosE/FosI family fosfomycin resistance thiol transferase [Paracoccus aurantiacus]
MTEGLSHITFICRDLDRMEEILTRVLLAKKIYDSEGEGFSLSPERFFDIGGVWVAVMQGDPLPERSYNHVAFKIADVDYDARLLAVRELGLDVRESRPRVEGEGRSIYFHDADNHLFELHTGTLAERLRRYMAMV